MKKLYPLIVTTIGILIWYLLSRSGIYHESIFPSPVSVVMALVEEVRSGRLANDLIASLFRVTTGFAIAVGGGIPIGLILGSNKTARTAFLPLVNFFRNLSPLAWIPFSVLWFGIGDKPAVFLIFLASFFPVVLSVMSATASIPRVYFRVAEDYGIRGGQLLARVTLPAIVPQIITTLRVTAGLSWLVVVAAEMIAGRDGLGFAIWDSRNGLRIDLLVAEMVVIGIIGVTLDRLLVQLTKIESIRWGYER